jgi:ADP-heptose:LPS heptosyltransferase
VLALGEHFSQASVTFFCPGEVAEYFHSITADASFVEYDTAQRYLFSPAFARHGAALAHERFDLCFLLDTAPDLAVLDLVGRTGARVRAGYAEAADFPFLNHIVKVSGVSTFLAERYSAMARSLGAAAGQRPTLEVSKDVREGLVHLLRDLRIDPAAPLATVDACGIARDLGAQWTSGLIERLRAAVHVTLCCPAAHGASDETVRWLAGCGVTVVPPLTVPRLAALVSRSQLVVTANSPLLQLTTLLGRPGVAVLPAHDAVYVRSGSSVRTVCFDGAPGEATAAAVVAEAGRVAEPGREAAAFTTKSARDTK